MMTSTEDGGYLAPSVTATPARTEGVWRVLIDIPHVWHGKKYRTVGAYAVFDDFGDLIIVAHEDGSVRML